jgi:hypothetical protein
MGRFFDKNEVFIIVIIILLLDLNSSCWDFLNHIIFKQKKDTLVYLAVLGLVLVDLYVLHEAVISVRQPPIVLSPTKNKEPKKCQDVAEEQIEEEYKTIGELKYVCQPDPNAHGYLLSEKLVMGFVAVVLIIIVGICLSVSEFRYKYKFGEVNDFNTRAWRCVPLILVAIGLIYLVLKKNTSWDNFHFPLV